MGGGVMKTCREIAATLSDYLEGQMAGEDSVALGTHIKDCPACMAFVRSFKVAGEATKAVLMRQIPGDFQDKLKAFLKEKTRRI